MSVYKRGGVWWAKFAVGGAVTRVSLELPATVAEARARKAETAKKAALEGEAQTHAGGRWRLSQACAIWYEEHGARLPTAKTLRDTHLPTLMANVATDETPDPWIDEIDRATIARAMNRRRGMTVPGPNGTRRPVAEATVEKDTRALLRRVLHYMRDTHAAALPRLPWERLKGDVPRYVPQVLKDNREAEFWLAVRSDYHDVVEFGLLSGLRAGQLLGMRWPDVDLEGGTVTVKAQKRKKGAALTREVVLGERALELVREQVGRHPVAVWTYDVRAPAQKGSRARAPTGRRAPITKGGLRQVWDAVQAVLPGLRVHDMRHTVGTRMLRATNNLKLVQETLGHASIATTAQFYAHPDADDLRDAQRKLAAGYRPRAGTTAAEGHKSGHKADAIERQAMRAKAAGE